MRCAVVLSVLGLAAAGGAQEQEAKPAATPVRKGDSLTVKGCLAGGALEATESTALEDDGVLASGLTFRLTGNKGLLKDLRESHDGRVVTVTGVLKSDLPKEAGQSAKVGRMRITIGGANPSPHSPLSESRRVLPVLEVKSFDGSATSCGR
jgi:hypothetical protein